MAMFKFFFRKKNVGVSERPVSQGKSFDDESLDGEILDAHLCSIKLCLREILNYKKKRFAPTPTHVYWRAVDPEEAWESVQEALSVAFRILCKVSSELHVASSNPVFPETSFHEALHAVIDLIDQIDRHVQTTAETRQHSGLQLQHIDDEILQVQHMANKINKHVTKDFKYSA